jgi:hypothetical protein
MSVTSIDTVLDDHRDVLFRLLAAGKIASCVDLLEVYAGELDWADVIAWRPSDIWVGQIIEPTEVRLAVELASVDATRLARPWTPRRFRARVDRPEGFR